jgi:hypothetical protein
MNEEHISNTTECHDLGVQLYTGYGLVNAFTDHLYISLETTSNHSTIADIHTLPVIRR